MPLFDPDDIAALLVKKLGLTQAAAARSRASWSRAGMKPDARFASGGGEAAGPVSWLDDVVGKTGNGSVIGAADLAAIASEFLVEERESRDSLPRQLRVTLSFHG